MVKVSIWQGTLKGSVTKTDKGVEYYEFLGVPYAKPPLGELRFKSPQAPNPWNEERDATRVSANQICCCPDMKNEILMGSEDCLYLNVYTPQLPDTKKPLLPVIVYIHGGGFFAGNGIIKNESGPDFLINNNVVVVSINYRLGIFGFLSLDIPEAAGNMGLKDQVQALKWVQDNIEKFGGDKSNVTIQGISAGAASCEYLILSPLAKGLFHKAIIQSGSTLNHWAINLKPKSFLIQLLKELNYTENEDNRSIYEFLLSLSMETLVKITTNLMWKYTNKRVFFGFVPTIEKDFGNGDAFLTENPLKLLQEGKFTYVPILRGFCDREGSLTSLLKPFAEKSLLETKIFTDHLPYEIYPCDRTKYNALLMSAYSENINPDDEPETLAADFFGDIDFVAGILYSSEMIAIRGNTLYMYQLCYDGNINQSKVLFGLNGKGAAHGDDLSYVLNISISHLADERDAAVRDKITMMWTNFAKVGNPTPDGSDLPVQWPQFTPHSKMYLNIDEEFTIESNYQPRKMAIFKELYNKYMK